MTGFWYPYADFGEAKFRLCRFADASVGANCGISFSDGQSISVVRRAGAEHALWLNVLTHHVAAPPAPPPPPVQHWYSAIEDFFKEGLRAQYQSELAAN